MLFQKHFGSEAIDELRSRVRGSVVLSDDSEYDKQRKPWLEVVEQRPSVIVNATCTEDIVETVRLARALELPLGVQNTGHGIALPCNEGVLLRLSAMKGLGIDGEAQTATIEPGVSSGELLKAAEPLGLAYPGGQVSNVGVTGYTLGGGYGWLGRKVGAAAGAVVSATVVLADGSVVSASATENAELLWALRGGGGNFGVVASMTVRLVRLGPIFGGMAYYRMEDAPEVLRFYRGWAAGLGDDTSSIVRLMAVPPKPSFLLHLRSTQACAIGVCHTDPETAEELHRQIRAFREPAIDELAMRPYAEMATFDAASDEKEASTFSHVEALPELSDAVIEGLLAIAKAHMPPLVLLELQHLGGALRTADRDAMAYTAPGAEFYLKLVSPTLNATLEQLALVTKEEVKTLGPVFTGEVPYNYLHGDEQHRVRSAFGAEKYKRLRALKRRYDPENVFHLNMNIAPAEE